MEEAKKEKEAQKARKAFEEAAKTQTGGENKGQSVSKKGAIKEEIAAHAKKILAGELNAVEKKLNDSK